mmetsp:Transcript_81983/g.220170  ORF Transcript_81983/g.220170 Transcript_81983/m.220170 type:complete len:202 (+) Transcript_81983:286-891(+)
MPNLGPRHALESRVPVQMDVRRPLPGVHGARRRRLYRAPPGLLRLVRGRRRRLRLLVRVHRVPGHGEAQALLRRRRQRQRLAEPGRHRLPQGHHLMLLPGLGVVPRHLPPVAQGPQVHHERAAGRDPRGAGPSGQMCLRRGVAQLPVPLRQVLPARHHRGGVRRVQQALAPAPLHPHANPAGQSRGQPAPGLLGSSAIRRA